MARDDAEIRVLKENLLFVEIPLFFQTAENERVQFGAFQTAENERVHVGAFQIR